MKKSIMIPSGRTNKSIKIFSNIICKKGGNYRHDRCFASNTFEDMLQPKTSIKNTKYKEIDQTGLKWTNLD